MFNAKVSHYNYSISYFVMPYVVINLPQLDYVLYKEQYHHSRVAQRLYTLLPGRPVQSNTISDSLGSTQPCCN